MDALTFEKERRRICEENQNPMCVKCPLNKFEDCQYAEPEELVKAVEEWSKEPTVMTNRKKFEEVFGCDMSWLTKNYYKNWIPIEAMPNFIRSRDWWNAEYKEEL